MNTSSAIVPAVFGDRTQLELAHRQAKVLAASELLPDRIRKSIANCMIVLDMAQRMGVQPALLARKLYFIGNQVGMGAELMIAAVNSARTTDGRKKWSNIRYRWVGAKGSADWGCRAFATDLETGEECEGSLVDLHMVKAEGWDKNPKWRSMTEHMLRFRAATFWVREYASELAMGMLTDHELRDIQPVKISQVEVIPDPEPQQQPLEEQPDTEQALQEWQDTIAQKLADTEPAADDQQEE